MGMGQQNPPDCTESPKYKTAVNVDASRCIGCGMCAAAVPAVFQIQGRVSVVQAQPRTPAEEAGAFDAANGCPVNAIRARKA